MTESWKIQSNIKLADGTLINLRADNADEASAILTWATNNAKLFTDATAAFVGTSAVTATLPVASVQTQAEPQPWQQPQAAPPAFAPQAAPAAAGGKVCQHGAMVYREGTSAKGPWKAYFCPTAKGSPGQCSPEFIR